MNNTQWSVGQQVKKFSVIQNKTIYGVVKKVHDDKVIIKWKTRKIEDTYNASDENIQLLQSQ